MNPSIRPLDPARDLEAVSALCDELGYPTPVNTLQTRLAAIAAQGAGHGLFVAQDKGQVVGWVHIYGVRLLDSPGYAELGGLVVSQKARRGGWGRALVEAAQQWALQEGFGRLRLYSGPQRLDAHRFYRRLGFEEKHPHMFQLHLR